MCGPNSRGDTVAGELHRGSIEEAGKETVDCSLAVDLWLFIEDVAIVLSVRLISYLRLHGF